MQDELRAKIRRTVRGLEQESVDLLRRLVCHDSTLGAEHSAQAEIANVFIDLGLNVEIVSIDINRLSKLRGFSPPVVDNYDGRNNVVGIHLPGTDQTGRSLILNGHMDVVPTGPVEKWTRPPFEPFEKDGWLYGRGSGDMKAGIVAFCTAFKALRECDCSPAAPVYLQSVIEEECTGNGALACLDAGYRADAAIIPEPFGQGLMVAQLGVMWLELDFNGKPAHVLDTSSGSNAIEAAFAVFDGLRLLEALWNSDEYKPDEFVHNPHPINFNLGKISGGDWASTVPSFCTASVRVGFYPDMEIQDVKHSVEKFIHQTMKDHPACHGVDCELRYRGFQAEGCVMDVAHPMMELLADLHREVTGEEGETLASTATTDARFFQIYGDTPATCYGPIAENIHGIDERVNLDSMMQVAEVLALFMLDWCGVESNWA